MKKYLLLLVTAFLYAGTASLVLENDAIVGKDNHYTNGLYYVWMSDKNTTFPDILSFIPLEQKNIAFSISHGIFTPKDKKISTVDLDDLPYAGYLNINFLFYKSSPNFFHELGVSIGMVGPSTHADDLQKGFHSLIGHDKPQGWDNQLGDHFISGISYNIGYKTNPIKLQKINLDFTTNAKADLGNFYTGILIGGSARLSSFPMKSFESSGNFIGGSESLLLNYQEKKDFNWALSFGMYYNKFDKYYLIDEAIDKGYHLKKLDYMIGQKVSLDLYWYSFKTSIYLKAVDIYEKSLSSTNEKTGGVSIVWKF